LCGKAVESKCRQETHNPFGYALACEGKAVVFSEINVRRDVESSCDTTHKTPVTENPQILARYSVSIEVSGPQNARVPHKLQHPLCPRFCHASPIRIFTIPRALSTSFSVS